MGNRHLDSLTSLDEWHVTAAIFEAVPDSILIADERGYIQMVNDAALRNFGYSKEELLGENLAILMPESHARNHDQYIQNYCRTGKAKVIGIGRELMGKRKDGSEFPLHFSISEFTMGGTRYFVGIGHDISEQIAMSKRLHAMATRDSLTGSLNRQEFLQRLRETMNTCLASGQSLAILFVDLDGFKQVNDVYGHAVGDKVLAMVGERFRNCLRDTDLLGRVGGDELAVAFHLEKPGLAQDVASRLQDALKEPLKVDQHPLQISASIGVSIFPEHDDDPDLLINDADMAMFQGKREASGTIRLFNEDMRQASKIRHKMQTRLAEALDRDRLELHYQLQFDLQTMEPSGMEALLRWHDGDTLVPPETFLPEARHCGLMPDINEWVIQQASRDNASLISHGLLDIPVTINIGANSFTEQDFVSRLRALAGDQFPPNRLELEITESEVMKYESDMLNNTEALAAAGISLAMDDFGTGYSSLARLRCLDFDKLKIDRSFVAALPEDTMLIRSILGMAHSLGLRVIAEGIENQQQLITLRELGCEMGQGFWLAKPLPFTALCQWLEQNNRNTSGTTTA